MRASGADPATLKDRMQHMREPNPDQLALHQWLKDRATAPTFAANPMARALGTRLLALDADSGAIQLAFAPEGIFVQGVGVLQGGALTAMLDFAMAFSLLGVLPPSQGCTTASVNVSLLRAAPRGLYLASGEIEKRGRQLVFSRASLASADDPDRPVATATSTLVIIG